MHRLLECLKRETPVDRGQCFVSAPRYGVSLRLGSARAYTVHGCRSSGDTTNPPDACPLPPVCATCPRCGNNNERILVSADPRGRLLPRPGAKIERCLELTDLDPAVLDTSG